MSFMEIEKAAEMDFKVSVPQGCEYLFTEDARAFLVALHERFNESRLTLLKKREERQRQYQSGVAPTFKEDTRYIRESNWRIHPVSDQISDRRVEITGPTDAKMMINALNSGAKVFMADCEDSMSPTWENVVRGQHNLKGAVEETLTFTNDAGKFYQIGLNAAVLMVRPRGLHLDEPRVSINGEVMSGSLFDFGMYFFHNVHGLWSKGSAPYFYLAKLEDSEEAEWWNNVFIEAQRLMGIPRGTIKATVLVETFPLVYQMDEVLFALREHSAGLNCGRWDYLFSMIKTLGVGEKSIFPNRDQMTMTVPCMQAYSRLLIETCHRRGAHAMGGMAAQIPRKDNEEANQMALDKVKADKLREVRDGHDGTWVAHPGLVSLAEDIFNKHMPQPNQIETKPEWSVAWNNLAAIPEGTITEKGVRTNISVGIHYTAAWLSGQGAAAINYLMEDAATAEISRTQLWQWLKYNVQLESGQTLTAELFSQWFEEEVNRLKSEIIAPWANALPTAAELYYDMVCSSELVPFLTLRALPHIA